jgi:hypothetical protein
MNTARYHGDASAGGEENPRAGQGMVVLDIGGPIGALIITTPDTMAGQEIEICPAGTRNQTPDEGAGWWHGNWRNHAHPRPVADPVGLHSHPRSERPAWPHTAVLPRPTPRGNQCAAVFPGLLAGRYELWTRPDGPTALSVSVTGSQVTHTAWPEISKSPAPDARAAR